MELITILILAIAIFTIAYIVKNVQKAKAEKKGIYADVDKCPYHGDETPVGYETAPPAAAVVIEAKPKKKPATKKPSAKPTAKKPASSQKKK